MKYIFKHTVITRIMHAVHLISMIMLILSGFFIYAPSVFKIFPSMDAARYVHFIFMYFIGWTRPKITLYCMDCATYYPGYNRYWFVFCRDFCGI